MNKVTITINSRQYTVIAEESEEYIAALGKHVSDKVDAVLSRGTNVAAERPLVLAALNICDEYFKVNEAGYTVNEQLKNCTAKLDAQVRENAELKKRVTDISAELDEVKSGQISMDETEMIASQEETKKQLSEAQRQIKFLEGQIKIMEEKQKEMKREFAAREQEILDLIDKQ